MTPVNATAADGAGELDTADGENALGQYDVILATAEVKPTRLAAAPEQPLHFMSYYLPKFLP